MDSRYLPLKKENDQSMSYLGDEYKRIAEIIVKKARGFAAKSVDTEVKIKDILLELSSFESKNVSASIAIPNLTNYVETKMKNFSKKYIDVDQIKGIIAVVILLVVSCAWIIVGHYLGRSVSLDAPKDFHISKVEDNKVTLSWTADDFTNEYVIYYKDNRGNVSASRTISATTYTFELELGKTYTFYLYGKETEVFTRSKEVSIQCELK